MSFKLATWNVNSLRVRLPHLTQWLAANPLEAIALQETKLPDADFPAAELQALGWHSIFSGQRTYNGVAILSREPATDVVAGIPGFDDDHRRVLAATVANGQSPGTEKYQYKLRWFEALRAHVAAELQRFERLVVLGDFNVAPEDRDVHDPKAWEGSIHVSAPERAALQAVADAGLADCYRRFEQPGMSFSWWDYRMMAFRRNAGLRIDLILASEALARNCVACHIDPAPRRLERPSDHAPVVATFDI